MRLAAKYAEASLEALSYKTDLDFLEIRLKEITQRDKELFLTLIQELKNK
jgi:hypothetical protein